jgi:hypothetical protein
VTWKSKFIAVLLILALCTPALAIGQDKVGHFAVGAGLGWVGTTAENGFWASVTVSALKEAFDACGNGMPEVEDFLAGALGALLTYLIRTQFTPTGINTAE